MTSTVGTSLFALWCVSSIIVLLNMLIAMMSRSFDAIAVSSFAVYVVVVVVYAVVVVAMHTLI